MALSPEEIDAWARAYVQAQQDPDLLKTDDHPLWWAVDEFMDEHTEAEAEDCWNAILRILELDPPDEVMGMLAAGPLEDLIGYHGQRFIDRIEEQSRRSSKFRYLLGGVWKGGSIPEIWVRVEACRGEVW
jgi:hypothetical protein